MACGFSERVVFELVACYPKVYIKTMVVYTMWSVSLVNYLHSKLGPASLGVMEQAVWDYNSVSNTIFWINECFQFVN